jgi:hypothetical protein
MLYKTLLITAVLILGSSSTFAQNSLTTPNKHDQNQTNKITQTDKKDSGKINPNELLPKLNGPKEIVIRKDIDVKSDVKNNLWDKFWKLPRQERMGILAIVGVSLLVVFGVTQHFLTKKKPK